MNADRLLTLYDRLADAPDAIPRLRHFVLDLAVRGNLVEQDPADESASELLRRIAVEKARLVKTKEIRKPKVLRPHDPESRPFGVPSQWTWARLDELSPRSLTDGDWIETKDQSPDGGVRLVQLADVGVGVFINKSNRFVTHETAERLKCTRLVVGDVLIARLPNPIGRACIFPDVGQPAITAVDVAILRTDKNIAAEYVVVAMNSPSTRNRIEAYGKGATRFRVSTGHLRTVLIPVPPLAEQRRIVAKVDELMALCDWLETARSTRDATRDRLTAASLARLTAPETDAEVFRTHARFTLDAFTALTVRPDQIKSLRKTILNLAVHGKLVDQDPTDQPASRLLEKLMASKVDKLHQLCLRGERQLPAVAVDEAPFDLPASWKWVRTQDISLKISDGVHKKPHYVSSGIPFLTVKNLTAGPTISFRDTKFISESDHRDFIKRTHPEKGDILITKDGTIGVTRVIDTDREFSIFVSVALVKMIDERIAPFLSLCLNSEAVQAQIIPKGAALKHLHLIDLRKLPIPLPPLAEQRRIVVKVDALMTLCDRLEASLLEADTTRCRLLGVLLHDALHHEELVPAVEALEAAG